MMYPIGKSASIHQVIYRKISIVAVLVLTKRRKKGRKEGKNEEEGRKGGREKMNGFINYDISLPWNIM